ncbi:hypothetical protein [Planomonospora algeriensis]
MLETQRGALLKQVKTAFKAAYGLADKKASDVELGFDDHLVALPDIGGLTLPFGTPLREAVRDIAGKLLAHQFPAHPVLDRHSPGVAVKLADARTVFAHVRAAAESRDGRAEIPDKDRKLMERVAEPLELGQQKEAYFALSTRWADHFRRMAQAEGVTGDLSLITLVGWTDEPERRGLEPFLANLVVAAFAEMDDRVWVRGGVPLDPAPELSQIKPGDALRSQPLPSEDDWIEARQRYETIFGSKAPTLRRGRMVNQFARQIAESARAYREQATELVRRLEAHATFLALDETDEKGRLALARRARDLLETLTATGGGSGGASGAKKTIEALAHFDLGQVSADRYGTCVKRAHDVAQALAAAAWDTLELAEGQGAEGQALLQSLRGVAQADQLTADLIEALAETRREVTALVKRNQLPPVPPVAPPPPPPGRTAGEVDLDTSSSHPRVPGTTGQGTGTGSGTASETGVGVPGPGGEQPVRKKRTTAAKAAADLRAELADLAARNPGATIEITWRVVD